METINICFITDNGFALPTSVALTSARVNKDKKTVFEIYIICVDVTPENIKKLEACNAPDFKIVTVQSRRE